MNTAVQLCSLNPGVERLAFSVRDAALPFLALPRPFCQRLTPLVAVLPQVIWTLSPDGQILDSWFGRTVINSCFKLNYGQAQAIIDGQPVPDHQGVSIATGIQGGHSVEDLKGDVINLNNMALRMRARRFDCGFGQCSFAILALRVNAFRCPLTGL